MSAAAATAAEGGGAGSQAYFATGWTGGRNPWVIALVVTMATFMEVLDTSIANVSLPHIAGNLSVSQDESTWVLTSYLVSNAVVLPISGWLSTRIGRKRFYMGCVALFTVSSFLCGVAPTLGSLIFFRILQGIGGGGLGPSEQAILADTFPPAKRGMAFAVYGMAVVLAPAIGPTLGGFITDHFNWRWIFFINVPIAILSLFLTSRLVEDPPHIKREVKGIVLSRVYALGSGERPAEAFAAEIERPLTGEQLARSWRIAAGLSPNDDQLRRATVSALPEVLPREYNATYQQAEFLANSPLLSGVLKSGTNGTVTRLAALPDQTARIKEAFLDVDGRPPDADETAQAKAFLKARSGKPDEDMRELLWALMTSAEFLTMP